MLCYTRISQSWPVHVVVRGRGGQGKRPGKGHGTSLSPVRTGCVFADGCRPLALDCPAQASSTVSLNSIIPLQGPLNWTLGREVDQDLEAPCKVKILEPLAGLSP